MNRYPVILIFGPPGSGKGTQSKSLSSSCLDFYHCSSGDIFRSLDRNSSLGKQCHQYSNQGLLVPDEITIDIWCHWMNQNIKKSIGEKIVLLDGIPRNIKQAKLIEPFIDIIHIINLKCDQVDHLIQRIKQRSKSEHRVDDIDEQIIHKRLDIYKKESSLVLDYYYSVLKTSSQHNRYGCMSIHNIDATMPLLDVLCEIVTFMCNPERCPAFENYRKLFKCDQKH